MNSSGRAKNMDRVAVFVDAGYLFAEGARLLSGEKPPRAQCRLDHGRVLRHLVQWSERLSQLPLLRTYWYDAASAGPSATQTALSYQPSLKLRLGRLHPEEGQADVDPQIVADLSQLASNGAMTDALLLAGDGDLLPGVSIAQAHGVRVHLLGIAPARSNQSGALVREADTVHEMSREDIASFLTISPG